MNFFPTAIHELADNRVVLAFVKGYNDRYDQGESHNSYSDQLLWQAYQAGYDKGVAVYCDEIDSAEQSYNDDMDGDHASALALWWWML